MPKDEDFYDGYEDGCYDLVVMDEFKSHKKIQFLNAWCDGQPLPLRQKGCQSVKNDNLPLIVCSNFSIENCYHEGSGVMRWLIDLMLFGWRRSLSLSK